jgi:ATP-dependent RNA helicase HelY
VSGGRIPGYAVVLSADNQSREPRPAILTEDGQLRRISSYDVDGPVSAESWIRIPKSFNAKVPKSRRDLASALRDAVREGRPPARTARNEDFGRGRNVADQERKIAGLRKALRSHPCHGCSEREDHARWSERWWKLRQETDGLARQIQGRTNTIAKTFDRVCDVLSAYGYLENRGGGHLAISADGQRLRRIYGEKDLLISQAIRQGAISDLDAVELAAFSSALVYQAKREDRGLRPRMPSVSLEESVDIVVREWSRLEDLEEQNKLPLTAEPELGLIWPMYKWAKGRHLQDVLNGTDLAAGDFVRWAKQVVDLLDQLAKIPGLEPRLTRICREAIDLVRRGVVAYSNVA